MIVLLCMSLTMTMQRAIVVLFAAQCKDRSAHLRDRFSVSG